jgi:phenylalanyl-tRNA synthetase beta chain
MFFDGKLPSPEEVAKAFTFHAWEIDGMEEKEGTTVLDVKVLPDKSAWALSHRGIAKDLSVVLNTPLARDPFRTRPDLEPKTDTVSVTVTTPKCRRYIAAYLKNVKVQESPEWLKRDLRALGQRPINNIVDITNYVMLGMGQPLHAFDAKKLSKLALGVRAAKEGEKITTLTGEEYALSADDMVIVDGGNDAPVGIAGVKGGKAAEIDQATTDIIIESANFDPVSVRKTSQRLKLRTEASMRYENGVVPDLTAYGVRDAVKFITDPQFLADFGGGELVGYVDAGSDAPVQPEVSVSIPKINSVLGLSLTKDTIDAIIARFGYSYRWDGETLSVTPPFERPDLVIAEDLIEEIGRIHGYDHVTSVVPEPLQVAEINKTFYYIDRIREELANNGFSEVYTSSFREQDEIKMKNAFAADKGYLRSELRKNMDEALAKNAPNADLLGLREVRTFELGTVFTAKGEAMHIALGVRSPSGYKAKNDEPLLKAGMAAVDAALGAVLSWNVKDGIAEAELSNVLDTLPVPSGYAPFEKVPDATYAQFSQYPYVARDVAFWVTGSADAAELEALIRKEAGELLVRLSLFDEFSKEGRTSYAFRLILQSFEKTLSDEDVVPVMERVYSSLKEKGYEIR